MKRTTQRAKPADAILTADLHLTDSIPVSRTDDYISAQGNKLNFLQELSNENNGCPILCAGDIFHHWKASPWLCSWAFCNLPGPMYTIPGNHDLPMHQLEYYDKSALCLLEEVCENLEVLKGEEILTLEGIHITGVAFGELKNLKTLKTKEEENWSRKEIRILMLHELIWPDKKPMWGQADDWSGPELLKKYGKYFDLIVTGDNHESFVLEDKKTGTLLVNPGSMMRITADQEDFQPKCYLYYAESNTVKEVKFPIEKGVHNREHIDQKKDKDERIAAYIERMNEDWQISLSFPKNLQAFFAENNTNPKVRGIIWSHLEAEEM